MSNLFEPYDFMDFEPKTIVLERENFRQSFLLDRYLSPPQKAGMCSEYVYYVETYLGKKKMGETVLKRPKDWWEYFKQRWFPDWLLKKYPLKFERIEITVDALFPKVNDIEFPAFVGRPNYKINYIER